MVPKTAKKRIQNGGVEDRKKGIKIVVPKTKENTK